MAKNNLDKAEHYKTLADIYCLRLEKEKQQLISFLEDKIRQCEQVGYMNTELNIYKEVLDFVNKGDK